jgi:hypothetical protein
LQDAITSITESREAVETLLKTIATDDECSLGFLAGILSRLKDAENDIKKL